MSSKGSCCTELSCSAASTLVRSSDARCTSRAIEDTAYKQLPPLETSTLECQLATRIPACAHVRLQSPCKCPEYALYGSRVFLANKAFHPAVPTALLGHSHQSPQSSPAVAARMTTWQRGMAKPVRLCTASAWHLTEETRQNLPLHHIVGHDVSEQNVQLDHPTSTTRRVGLQ